LKNKHRESAMKKSYKYIIVTIILLALSTVVTIMGCGMEELYSAWCDRHVTVDGINDDSEWARARHYVYMPDGGFTVGILNDEKMLYLRLSTRNQALQRKIMTAGLFVWLNETGNQKLNYGVHFPLPAKDGDPSQEERPTVPGKNGINLMEPSGKSDPFIAIPQKDIEIIGPGKNERGVIVADHTSQDGFRCHIGKTRDVLVYELQVPLIKSGKSSHGIAINKPKIVGIGLVTGENERSRQDRDDRESGPGGGREQGGKGGGHPGGSGQSPQGQHDRGGMQDKEQSIDLWLKVHLAERP
jgi:hypothetical protein